MQFLKIFLNLFFVLFAAATTTYGPVQVGTTVYWAAYDVHDGSHVFGSTLNIGFPAQTITADASGLVYLMSVSAPGCPNISLNILEKVSGAVFGAYCTPLSSLNQILTAYNPNTETIYFGGIVSASGWSLYEFDPISAAQSFIMTIPDVSTSYSIATQSAYSQSSGQIWATAQIFDSSRPFAYSAFLQIDPVARTFHAYDNVKNCLSIHMLSLTSPQAYTWCDVSTGGRGWYRFNTVNYDATFTLVAAFPTDIRQSRFSAYDRRTQQASVFLQPPPEQGSTPWQTTDSEFALVTVRVASGNVVYNASAGFTFGGPLCLTY